NPNSPLTPTLSPLRGEGEDRPLSRSDSSLVVLVRDLAQLEAALRCGVATIYCDFENPKKYRDAVQMARNFWQAVPAKAGTTNTIWVAPPRIFKTGEEWILKQVRSCEA